MKGDSESVTVTEHEQRRWTSRTGSSPNDGRTEKNESRMMSRTGNNYTGTKPSADTIVFRSYKDPDET